MLPSKHVSDFFLLKCLLTLIFAMSALSATALVEETASLQEFLYGFTDQTAYDNFYARIVSRVAREDWNQYAPWEIQSDGFGEFILPGAYVLDQWGIVVNYFLEQEFEQAEAIIEANNFPYDIVRFNDTDTGRTLYMLRERLNMDYFCDNGYPDNPEIHQHGSFDYGWGLYLFNPHSESPIIITTPHPKDDFITVPISGIAFKEWDARYLMIAGAGREVMWTEEGPYLNSKSLSDPTRREEHPFNVFYKAACADIRATFGRREFSPQIHSFDYTHMGYNNLQLSAGSSGQNYPGLPIRDLSGNFLDIVNAAPYVIFPENSIGNNEEVLVTDYYSVHYRSHGHYYNHEDEQLEICNNINLPGYGNNRQVAHTLRGWNRYDIFSPFFHIEMEELPSCFEQDMETYRWFYGYDEETETWDAGELFTRAIQFYTPWVEHMAEVLPHVLHFDDEQPPTNPADLIMTNINYHRVTLSWDRSYDYDFKTYQILYANEPIDLEEPNYGVIDRNSIATLAGQAFDSADITSFSPGITYYVKIRAKDYSDNYSQASNQVVIHTIPAEVTSLDAYGRDGEVDLEWFVSSQRNNRGFTVWRHNLDEDIREPVADWESDTLLVGVDRDFVRYYYTDDTAENGVLYEYYIYSSGQNEEDYRHRLEAQASPEPIYSLIFSNDDGTVVDSVEFGMNRFSQDGYDSDYDISKESLTGEEEDFIYSVFYYPAQWYEPSVFLQRDICEYFDRERKYKNWQLRACSDLIDEPLTISVSDNYPEHQHDLFLKCSLTQDIHCLTEQPLYFQFENDNYRYWVMYWGDLLPEVTIEPMENQYLQANQQVRFAWEADFRALIDSYDLYLLGKQDSLLIDSGLASDMTYYDWEVPDSLFIYDLSLVVRAYLEEEEFIDFKSPFKLGIVDTEMGFKSSPGWNIITNPFKDTEYLFADIFGADAVVYSPYISEPDSLRTFDFGKAYWVFHEEEIPYNLSGNTVKRKTDIDLNRGWTLVPHPYLQDYAVHDLIVLEDIGIGYITKEWEEAVGRNLVAESVFGMIDNRYAVVDTLKMGKAYWVYANGSNYSLRFVPFNEHAQSQRFEPDWQVAVRASQLDFLEDEIIIGAPRGHFSPKPPSKPGQKCVLYIDETMGAFDKLHSYYKTDLQEDNSSQSWPFKLKVDSMIQPVLFSYTGDSLPEEYKVVLMIDEYHILMKEGKDFSYLPSSNTVYGQIKVTNQDVASIENIPQAPVLFSNYPNPFGSGHSATRSGGTNISFFVDQPAQVSLDIFNVKGQLIDGLLNEKLEPGKYSVHWNGRMADGKRAPSGVYFYRLTVNDNIVAHKKMLMVR